MAVGKETHIESNPKIDCNDPALLRMARPHDRWREIVDVCDGRDTSRRAFVCAPHVSKAATNPAEKKPFPWGSSTSPPNSFFVSLSRVPFKGSFHVGFDWERSNPGGSRRRRNVETHPSRRAHRVDEAHARWTAPWRLGVGGSRGWPYWVRARMRRETTDGRRRCVEGRGGRSTDHVEDASVPRCTRVQDSSASSDNRARCA